MERKEKNIIKDAALKKKKKCRKQKWALNFKA